MPLLFFAVRLENYTVFFAGDHVFGVMETLFLGGRHKRDEYIQKLSLCKQFHEKSKSWNMTFSNFQKTVKVEKTIAAQGINGCGKLCGKCV